MKHFGGSNTKGEGLSILLFTLNVVLQLEKRGKKDSGDPEATEKLEQAPGPSLLWI